MHISGAGDWFLEGNRGLDRTSPVMRWTSPSGGASVRAGGGGGSRGGDVRRGGPTAVEHTEVELQQMFRRRTRCDRSHNASTLLDRLRLSQNKDYRAPFRPRDYSISVSLWYIGTHPSSLPQDSSSIPWVDRSRTPAR